jgi:hypothetical protein
MRISAGLRVPSVLSAALAIQLVSAGPATANRSEPGRA